jgi:prefoldin subunit 5
MRDHIEQRLRDLREEFAAGQKMMAELDAQQTHVRSSLLRLSGAIQVLEELMNRDAGAVHGNGAAHIAGEPQAARL